MKAFLRKNIYKWHRITSLVVVIPVLLWTLSGFLHPVMGLFKPQLMNHSLAETVIDTSRIRLSPAIAFQQHNIRQINNFRIVELYNAYYYQVKQKGVDTLSYISCFNGQWLPDGDQQYATYLAQRFLSDPDGGGQKNDHHGASADLASVVKKHTAMKMRFNTNITAAILITRFNNEYKSSNVLLPVYRVQFDRDDHLRLYVETSTGKLSTAIDDKRAWFLSFFAVTHSWSFMNSWGAARHMIIGFFSLTCFLTSILGFCVYNIIKKKKKEANSTGWWHRTIGNIFVITTLLYSFSGAWHSLQKLNHPGNEIRKQVHNEVMSDDLNLYLPALLNKLGKSDSLLNISVVKIHHSNFWQVTTVNNKKIRKKYFNTPELNELPGGDEAYGRYLASQFSGLPLSHITHSSQLRKFNDQYSMMKKRLPVIEVGMGDKNYYVETSTGYLSAVSRPSDKAERFSFSNFHMHHYWENWFGKEKGRSLKNIFLISSTLGLMLLAVTGMMMYRCKMKKRKLPANYPGRSYV